jgi:serine/threonine protein kinase
VSEPLHLRPGSVFAGDYKVIRPLRTGGMGSLYVVEQLSTSKQRALKLMLPELVAQPASRKRFELEAKIAARIQSDHVVESIASGVDQKSGIPWLAMELLEGQDLSAYTAKRKHLAPAEVLEIFDQLCHALGEAHKQGIVHRDIKPENIFLATARRRGVPFMVKVLDFGIARILAESQTMSGGTRTGLGTPMWMAPEQTQPGGPIAPASDVWALGLIAFRLLTGYYFWKAPYDPSGSVMMLMAEAFMHQMPTASARAAEYRCADRIPPGFDAWFAKCVARPIEDRYADASEVFVALEPILKAAIKDTDLPSRASIASGDAPPVSQAKPAVAAAKPDADAEPAGDAAPAPDGDAADAPAPSTELPAALTGPGRATWGGAPELSESAVLSAAQSQPMSWEPTPPPAPSSAREREIEDDLPPIPPPRGRSRALVLAGGACAILAVAIVAWRVGAGPRGASGSPPSTVAARQAPPPAGSTPPVDSGPAARGGTPEAPSAIPSGEPAASPASASASASASAPEPAESATTAVKGRLPRLCKAAGAKCFGNDDCCDRTCRKWTCQLNRALQDPYDK